MTVARLPTGTAILVWCALQVGAPVETALESNAVAPMVPAPVLTLPARLTRLELIGAIRFRLL
jgi:hypothetical protein